MRRLNGRITSLAASLTLAAGALLAMASPASAGIPSCYGSSCNGLDPSQTACAYDATTVQTNSAGLELRYSPSCRAARARASGSGGDQITVQNSLGDAQYMTFQGSGTAWTAMVNDAGVYSFACQYYSHGGSSCTKSY